MGVEKVQSFPHLGHDLKREDVWPGPATIFQKAGFITIKPDDRRPVMELSL